MLLLYRIYQICIMLPLLLVATTLTALLTIIGSAFGGGRWWGYYPAVAWSRLFCILTLVKVTVDHCENIDKHTSYVFVANHQGAYDIFSIYGYLGHNFRWMMKQSLRTIPLVGFACDKAGHIYVDRSTPTKLRDTMQRAKNLLRHGMSLVVFPEGARTLDGRMQRFKRGAYTLATEFRLPVVPLTINGSYDIMPRQSKLPHWGHIVITIHKPIYPDTDGHDLTKLMTQSANAIASALPEDQRPQ